MKKLMIAAAIVCAAALSQAADANWKLAAKDIMNGSGAYGKDYLWSGSAYFFDASKADQKAIFEAFAADVVNFDITAQTGFIKEGVAESGTIANTTAANQFSYGPRSTEGSTVKQSFFFVLIDDKKMYLSADSASISAGGGDAAVNIPLGSQLAGSQILAAEGWQGAGKWSMAAVPEPTSGLLLLLGVAGLALKRRRA